MEPKYFVWIFIVISVAGLLSAGENFLTNKRVDEQIQECIKSGKQPVDCRCAFRPTGSCK